MADICVKFEKPYYQKYNEKLNPLNCKLKIILKKKLAYIHCYFSIFYLRPLIFLFLLFFPTIKFKAHEYFFAFAEVEYSEKSAKLEATLTLTSHDFETYLRANKITENALDKAFIIPNEFTLIEKEINSKFFFFTEDDDKQTNWISYFKIEGHQILLNGNIEIYLSCNLEKHYKFFSVHFDLLMDYFSEQQNKITFINKRKKSTFNFNLTNQIQQIEL